MDQDLDAEVEFTDTAGEKITLWAGAIGLFLVAGLGLLVIGLGGL